jgi:hypothetical protein
MRTDRELLELAAKAAGMYVLTKKPWPAGEEGWFFNQVGDQPPALYNRRNLTIWSPFADDGDALRLAINCDMTICTDGVATVSASSGYGHDKSLITQLVSECGGDKNAATRRAIVRAAAEIGAVAHPKQHNDGGQNA